VRYRRKKFTFAISSPDEFLSVPIIGLPVAVARWFDPPLTASNIHCVQCTSVLWMMSFYLMEQLLTNWLDDACVSFCSPNDGTGGEVSRIRPTASCFTFNELISMLHAASCMYFPKLKVCIYVRYELRYICPRHFSYTLTLLPWKLFQYCYWMCCYKMRSLCVYFIIFQNVECFIGVMH